jgi:hypothetical protein
MMKLIVLCLLKQKDIYFFVYYNLLLVILFPLLVFGIKFIFVFNM